MYRREEETPVGEKDMQCSGKEFAFEPQKRKYAFGDDGGACQSADKKQQQQNVQQSPDGAGRGIGAFEQGSVPVPVQPCVQQERSGKKDAQDFMGNVARMAISHEQRKQDDHTGVK